MPSLMSMLVVGALALTIYFVIKAAMASSKKEGIAEQQAKDSQIVAQAEMAVHDVQAEQRETITTKKRLKDGTF